ncbi:MAG: hypothetical protein AAFY57_19200 [Cyanobacteria bacterium J06642_2]
MAVSADVDVAEAVAQLDSRIVPGPGVFEWMFVASVSLALLAGFVLVSTMLYLAVRTHLRGRWLAFAGALVGGSVFLIEVSLYSGNFEFAFGPIGVMYGAVAYSGATILFCVGLLRMLVHRRLSSEAQNAT